tara:strand:- start:148 stop:318 length:171 start_codon:yes stop_codon:yes gene_type:complete
MANFLGMNRRKPTRRPRGFGDTVAKTINRYTNIKPKAGCGCKKRQEALNKMFPYRR